MNPRAQIRSPDSAGMMEEEGYCILYGQWYKSEISMFSTFGDSQFKLTCFLLAAQCIEVSKASLYNKQGALISSPSLRVMILSELLDFCTLFIVLYSKD
jgi:ribosome biogenesis protein Tsr3